MKHLLAGWLSLLLLFSGGAAFAEGAGKQDKADIEESVISVEGEDIGSLSENLLFLKDLTENEDVMALLKNKEVSSLASEITLRIIAWMYQNRPVAMKILAELGFSEEDLRCVEKIWDSLDRIIAAWRTYQKTEDGKQLQAEWNAVENDPEIRKSVFNFQILFNSEELKLLLNALSKAVEDEKAGREDLASVEEPLTGQAIREQITRQTFTGRLVIEILHVLEQSAWAKESLPNLLQNENLSRLLTHLSAGNPEMNKMLQEECTLIFGDPEVNRFLQKILAAVQALNGAVSVSAGSPDESTEAALETQNVNREETAP